MALDRAIDSAAHKAELKSIADSIRAKGGTTALFESAAAMKAAVDAIQTGGPAPVIQALTVTENGTYNVPSGVDGYGPVNVNVAGGGSEVLDALIDRSITEIHSNARGIGGFAFEACRYLTTAEFPSATVIGQFAFSDCYKLTAVDCPSLTSIRNSAFSSCSKLTTVNFPEAEELDSYAFRYCSALTTVYFPKARTLSNYALGNCSKLTTAELPSVTSIGPAAFNGSSELTALRLPGPTVCQATGDPGLPSGCQIFVPASLIDQYRVATNWSQYADQFVAIEGV